MASPNGKPQYYLPPNFDYCPGVTLSLGKIFSDPFDMGTCLNPNGPPEFPKNMKVQYNVKKDWKRSNTRSSSGLLSIFANFLMSVIWEKEKEKEEIFQFKILETLSIDPTLDYYNQCMNDEDVVRFIVENNFTAPVYMVTGVKIARKADLGAMDLNNLMANPDTLAAASGKVLQPTGASMDGDAQFAATGLPASTEADGTASQNRQVSMDDSNKVEIGAPVGGGVKLAYKASGAHHESWSDSSDFVFAYRIRKIWYDKGEKLKNKQLEEGALFTLRSNAAPIKENLEIVKSAVQVMRVANEDETVNYLKETTATAAFDDLDGEEVECRIPTSVQEVSPDNDELDFQ